jgi:polygalacturonase
MRKSKRRLTALRLCFGLCVVLFTAQSLPARSPGWRVALFNVIDYGAKKDGSALSTDAFRKAIAAAKAAGGGTIYVPPGRYKSGPIELFSNMTLDVDAGATIEFPVAPLLFEKTRYLGVETLGPMALIGGRNVENVTITGRGVLTTGRYGDWARAYGPPPAIKNKSENANGPHWEHLLQSLEAGRPVSEEEERQAAVELRPEFIYFSHSRNILVENVRIVGAPMFVVDLVYSEFATIRNLTIQAYPGPHVNGIVVDSSRFVRISGDYIDTGDDGIVVKAGKDADGLRVNRPSEDVTISNCTVHHAHGAVVIGSETSGSIRNIAASNITAVDTENGIRIKSRRGRGGVVEDLRFDNFTMEDVGTGIEVTSYYTMGGEDATVAEPVSNRTPVFRNIAISHVTISHATRSAVDIEGLPEMPLAGLRLMDIEASGSTGLVASYTKALEMHEVDVDARRGPSFRIDHAADLLLDNVSSSKPLQGEPVVRLTASPGAILRDSRAFAGTGTFLSAGRGELKTMQQFGNLLGNARTPSEER